MQRLYSSGANIYCALSGTETKKNVTDFTRNEIFEWFARIVSGFEDYISFNEERVEIVNDEDASKLLNIVKVEIHTRLPLDISIS